MLFSLLKNTYPSASKNRISATHPSLKVTRASFFQAAALNFVLLQLLFFGLLCYLFGSLFQQTSRTHALNVLWVDYDGGIIGDAVRDAYESLQSDGFPTLVERSIVEFPSEIELREAVCDTEYWAALYTVLGSSEGLANALSGAASQHNQSNVLFYIWNEAKYPTTLDSAVSSNLEILSRAAHASYTTRNSTFALAMIQPNDTTALITYANPWKLSSINIQPTTHGARDVYNTICIVLILIQDFFILLVLTDSTHSLRSTTNIAYAYYSYSGYHLRHIHHGWLVACIRRHVGVQGWLDGLWRTIRNQLANYMAFCPRQLPRHRRLHYLASAPIHSHGPH